MQGPEKIKISCPECGVENEILWFPKKFIQVRGQGTTGASGLNFNTRRGEKVSGKCQCGYKFKVDDL